MGSEHKTSDEHRKSCRRDNDDRRTKERRQHDEPVDPDLRSKEKRRTLSRREGKDRRD